MKVKLMFAWYDLWIGFFCDRSKRHLCQKSMNYLYFFPIPTIGFRFEWKEKIKCPKCKDACPECSDKIRTIMSLRA